MPAQGSQLELERNTVGQSRLPLIAHALQISRMKNSRAKLRAGDVGHRQARVIEGRPIRVERNAGGIEDDDVFGDRIGDPAERALVLAHLFLGLLEGVDVRAGSVPSNDLTRVIAYRFETSEHPAKRSVMATKASLEFATRARRHDLSPFLAQLRKVFGVNRLLPAVPACFFCRDPRVLLPPLVHELVRTIGRFAPGDCRDGVENGLTLGCAGFAVWEIGSAHDRRLRQCEESVIEYGVPEETSHVLQHIDLADPQSSGRLR